MIRDFQRIKYTVNKNDNHFKGGERGCRRQPLSPNKYARQMSAQREFLNAVSRIDIDYFGAFNFLEITLLHNRYQ